MRGNDDVSLEVAKCLESSGRAPGKKNLEAHEPQISWGQVGFFFFFFFFFWNSCLLSTDRVYRTGVVLLGLLR